MMMKEEVTATGNELQMEVTVTMDKKTGQGDIIYAGRKIGRGNI